MTSPIITYHITTVQQSKTMTGVTTMMVQYVYSTQAKHLIMNSHTFISEFSACLLVWKRVWNSRTCTQCNTLNIKHQQVSPHWSSHQLHKSQEKHTKHNPASWCSISRKAPPRLQEPSNRCFHIEIGLLVAYDHLCTRQMMSVKSPVL